MSRTVVQDLRARMRPKPPDIETVSPQFRKPDWIPPFCSPRRFPREGELEDSVFIMTKFPNGSEERDQKLRTVIQILQEEIAARGYKPRIASDEDTAQELLWDQVELFLLGCARGLVIVENKYQDELNPSVTMEWGWMRGMGRRILFLREEDFDKDRADILGSKHFPFDWDNPRTGIERALDLWLPSRSKSLSTRQPTHRSWRAFVTTAHRRADDGSPQRRHPTRQPLDDRDVELAVMGIGAAEAVCRRCSQCGGAERRVGPVLGPEDALVD